MGFGGEMNHGVRLVAMQDPLCLCLMVDVPLEGIGEREIGTSSELSHLLE